MSNGMSKIGGWLGTAATSLLRRGRSAGAAVGTILMSPGLFSSARSQRAWRRALFVPQYRGFKAKTGPFDFSFVRDQQAYLDFAYLANAEVAGVAKQIIALYYEKTAAYSYFVGCSTGGREGMILSQRYPTVFNGIVVSDPAMRTGFSNLAISQWIPAAYNEAVPKDASGKPEIGKFLTDGERKLFMDALVKMCDGLDGVADRMDIRSSGMPLRSRRAFLQAGPDGRMHCAAEDCGHQEGFWRADVGGRYVSVSWLFI